jgi:uncharacterized membrane protein
LKKSRKEGRNQIMTIMAFMKKHLILPGESFIQEYKSVSPKGREELKEYAREEMEHKGIEIDDDK